MPELSLARSGRRILFPVRVFRPGKAADMTSVAATALLDTGATVSGLGPHVVKELGLRSHMKKRLLSATEEVFADYYLFRIGLYTTAQMGDIAEALATWPFLFDEVEGFSWCRDADFDVILGMDILAQCDVVLGRHGTCQIRFG